MLTRSLITAAVLAAAVEATAQASERLPMESIKPLLLRAVDRGEAQGVLVGQAADEIARRYQTTAPIEVDVRAVQALPQAGCQRLQVVTRQQGVRESGKRPEAKTLTYQINYCRDGRFPRRGEP